MRRLVLAILFVPFQLRADIAGYAVTTPALDAEIHPRSVAAAPNSNVWFAPDANSIGFFTPSGHVTTFAIPRTGSDVVFVWDLAADRDGSVWFIDNHAKADGTSIDSAIGHLTESGQFTFFQIPTKNATAVVPNGFGQSSLAIAADGAIWFTENATYKAGRLVPSTGAFAEYPLEGPEQPSGITVGPDGKIWYTAGSSEIAQITPPTSGEFVEFGLAAGALPLDLVVGSDGNLWVTEAGRHKIARFKPASGIVNEFQPPANNGAPQHIVAAPDGTLWYTEAAGMDVGRITISGATPAFETIATPGQRNFDITVTPNNVVYVTGQGNLLEIRPVCADGPAINGPYEFTSTLGFHAALAISGKDPLTIRVQNLPAGWSAQTGKVTIMDSGASAAVGTYTFTISVTDAQGCSISQRITVHIIDYRRRAVRNSM